MANSPATCVGVEALVADDLVAWARESGRMQAAALPTMETLQRIGLERPAGKRLADAHGAIAQQRPRLDDEALLQGHGTLGGEEYLSYAVLSEAMVIAGGSRGQAWNESVGDRLAAVQNPDGSWSGHHCISSAVFCTAAAVQCLTVDSRLHSPPCRRRRRRRAR